MTAFFVILGIEALALFGWALVAIGDTGDDDAGEAT